MVIVLIISGIVVFIFLRLIMSSNKFGYWGNVLAYAVLSTLRNLIPGFEFGFFGESLNRFLNTFISTLIIGIPLIYILKMIDDKGSPKFFIVIGIILEVVIMLVMGLIAGSLFN